MPHVPAQHAWPLIAVVAILQPSGARGQSLLSGDEQNVVNFAFATQLGSGVYSVSGRTLQIYRLPFRFDLKAVDDSGFGAALTLPVTFGFYDFELQDVANGDLPDDVDTLSFVPGFALAFQLAPDWLLEPYIEAGISKARDTDADATVYSGGLASSYEFGGQGFDWQLRNDLTYAGVDLRGAGGTDHFTRFQTVVSARRPVSSLSRLDYLMYVLNDYYVDQPDGPVDSAGQRGEPFQFEIGVTLGTSATQRLWKIPLPRVGIGYRFGSDLEAWRIVFGTPY
ncbi:MAG TPA: hypothetical protein VFS23_12990 [Vicinamibacterales bacterium]|nr:hypothetical protein [Vicinamibacterales bacterium]